MLYATLHVARRGQRATAVGRADLRVRRVQLLEEREHADNKRRAIQRLRRCVRVGRVLVYLCVCAI